MNWRDFIDQLAKNPPRPAGSPGEAQGAQLLQEALAHQGLEAEIIEFRSPTGRWAWGVLGVLGAIGGFSFFLSPWVGYILSLFAFLGLTSEMRTQGYLTSMLRFGQSRNLVARQGQGKVRVVVSAPLDSPRQSHLTRTAQLPFYRRNLTWYILAAFLVFLFGGLQFLGVGGSATLFLRLVAALFLLAGAVIIFAHEKGRPLQGILEGGSGMAALVELARRTREELPSNLELWLVGTGASWAGNWGMIRLLKDHPELKGAYHIHLPQVGVGTLAYMKTEGVYQPLASDSKLLTWAEQVSNAERHLKAKPDEYRWANGDGVAVAGRRGKALTIRGITALPPWNHELEKAVDEDLLSRAVGLTYSLLWVISGEPRKKGKKK